MPFSSKTALALTLIAVSLPAFAEPLRDGGQLPSPYLKDAKEDAAHAIADFLHDVHTGGRTSPSVTQSTIKPLETPRKP